MKARLVAASLAVAVLAAPGAWAEEQPAVQLAEQEAVPPEVTTYLQEQPALKDMTPQELQQRMRAGRTYMNVEGLPRKARNQLANQVRAAKAELDSRKAEAQADPQQPGQKQTTQADAPAGGKNAAAEAFLAATRDLKGLPDAQLRRQARQGRALLSDRKLPAQTRQALLARVQALRAETVARQGQAKGQAAQTEPDGQPATGGNSDAIAEAYLVATENPSGLPQQQLTRRLRQGANLLKNRTMSAALRQAMTARVQQLRAEAANRQQAGGVKPDQPGATEPDAGGSAQTERVARALIADDRAPRQLSNGDLRIRLNAARAALAGGGLSRGTAQALRQKLVGDRNELRSRVDQAGKPEPGQPAVSEFLTDRRPASELRTPELRQRILALRDAFNAKTTNANRKEVFRTRLIDDRRELNRRLVADKTRREEGLRRYRDRSNVDVTITILNEPREERPVGYRPPPIWAAEADEEAIEEQLIAPPVRRPQRRYTVEQMEDEPEVRESMPAVELDTINFGFGEAFVREEELEDMDKIGEVLERILAAHPGEVFLIEGHTDAVGSDDANLTLSEQRADAVKEALASYYTIPARNLKTAGYGERYLKIDTEEPETENRRVTVRRITPLVGELEG